MKHNLTSNIIFKETHEVSKLIISKAYDTDCLDNKLSKELINDINPIVSNYTHTRVEKELENERFATLIKLARVFDEETLSKCINVLGYTLNIK